LALASFMQEINAAKAEFEFVFFARWLPFDFAQGANGN